MSAVCSTLALSLYPLHTVVGSYLRHSLLVLTFFPVSVIRIEEAAERKEAAQARLASPDDEKDPHTEARDIEGTEETVPHTKTNKVDAVRPGALPGSVLAQPEP